MVDVDALKRDHPIVDVLQRLGHEPPARWNTTTQFTIHCPSPKHEDTTPSCRVHTDTNRFHCFGCGEHGDVLDLARLALGLRTFQQAAEWLAAGRIAIPAPATPAAPVCRLAAERVLEINRHAWSVLADTDHAALARQYLRRRGLNDEALTAVLGRGFVGYPPAARDGLTRMLRLLGVADDELVDSGWSIATRDGLIDRFHRRVLFPIHDGAGELVGVTARDVTGTARAKYLNTRTTNAYRKGDHVYAPTGLQNLRGRVVVCEGPLDALAVTAAQLHRATAVALCGTAMTEHQATTIAATAGQRPVIVLADGDTAGQRASADWARRLRQAGAAVTVRALALGTDPAQAFTTSSAAPVLQL